MSLLTHSSSSSPSCEDRKHEKHIKLVKNYYIGKVLDCVLYNKIIVYVSGSFVVLYRVEKKEEEEEEGAKNDDDYYISKKDKKNYIGNYHLFNNHIIHGIKIFTIGNYPIVVLYGGKYIKIYLFNINENDENKFILISQIDTNYWIFDVKLIENISSNNVNNSNINPNLSIPIDLQFLLLNTKIYIGYSCNSISIGLFNLIDLYITMVENYWCIERSTLFSMSLIESNNSLIVAAGTVFNSLLIWSIPINMCDYNLNNLKNIEKKFISVLSRSNGLSGVCSSIHWQVNYDNKKYLCTSSDDRAVRLWQYNELDKNLELCWTSYGHDARVWKAIIVSHDSGRIILASVSEDRTVRIWSDKGILLDTINLSDGTIWSVASDSTNLLVGCGDSRIKLLKLNFDSYLNNFKTSTYIIEGDFQENIITNSNSTCNSKVSLLEDSNMIQYSFLIPLSSDTIRIVMIHSIYTFIVVTNSGKLFLVEFIYNTSFRWIALFIPAEKMIFNSCCVQNNIVYLGSASGNLVIINFEDLKNIKTNFYEIFTLNFIQLYCFGNILVCGNAVGEISFILIESILDGVKISSEVKLASQLTACAYNPDNKLFCFGDNKGSLYLSTINSILSCFPAFSNKINFLKFDGRCFVSTSDNTIKKYKIVFVNDIFQLDLLDNLHSFTSKPMFVDDIYEAGFMNNFFQVINNERNIMCNISCSSRRQHDFKIYEDEILFSYSDKDKFIVIKPKVLDIQSEGLKFHNRFVSNCILFKDMIITSSDDGNLSIISKSKIISSHTGDMIRCLSINENKCILFSGGGKERLTAFQIHNDAKLYVSPIATIGGAKSKNESGTKKVEEDSDDEVDLDDRILSMTSFNLNILHLPLTIVVTGNSRGQIKLFLFYKTFFPLSSGVVGRPIFSMIFSKYLITGDSSGKCIFWDVASEVESLFQDLVHGSNNLKLIEWIIQEFNGSINLEIISLVSILKSKIKLYSISEIPNITSLVSFEVHASGVNCMSIECDVEGNYIILSGGDDQSISLLKYSVVNDSILKLGQFISTFHTAAVKAVAFYQNFIISTGIDQRVNIYTHDNYQHLKLIFEELVELADISCIAINANTKKIVLAGAGLEQLHIEIK